MKKTGYNGREDAHSILNDVLKRTRYKEETLRALQIYLEVIVARETHNGRSVRG